MFVLLQVSSENISGVLFFGTVGLLFIIPLFLLVALYLYNRDKKREYESLILKMQFEASEKVQREISEEIHDNIGQLLGSTKILLGVAERQLATIPATLLTAEETLGKAIKELRALTKSLNTEWLSEFDLWDNLNTEILRINETNALRILLDGEKEKIVINVQKKLLIFRMLQEIIQNLLKHSDATELHVHFNTDNEKLNISLCDNGSSYDHTANKGLGTFTLRSRAKALGGTIEQTGKSGANKFILSIPLKQLHE